MSRQLVGLSEDGQKIEIKKFNGYLSFEKTIDKENQRIGAFLDVETTGLDFKKHKVIDVAIVLFTFDRITGNVCSILEEFQELQDPEEPLSEETKNITGYTDEDLKGKKINWESVDQLLSKAHILIAHNSKFDRPFLEKYSEKSKEKIWGCSCFQVDWIGKGHDVAKLSTLAKDHGFFFDAHKALIDVKAGVKLLSMIDPDSNSPYLFELLENAKIPQKIVIARGSKFDFKDSLKEFGFRWDQKNKIWKAKTKKTDSKFEDFIKDNTSLGAGVPEVIDISLIDNFKDND